MKGEEGGVQEEGTPASFLKQMGKDGCQRK